MTNEEYNRKISDAAFNQEREATLENTVVGLVAICLTGCAFAFGGCAIGFAVTCFVAGFYYLAWAGARL